MQFKAAGRGGVWGPRGGHSESQHLCRLDSVKASVSVGQMQRGSLPSQPPALFLKALGVMGSSIAKQCPRALPRLGGSGRGPLLCPRESRCHGGPRVGFVLQGACVYVALSHCHSSPPCSCQARSSTLHLMVLWFHSTNSQRQGRLSGCGVATISQLLFVVAQKRQC